MIRVYYEEYQNDYTRKDMVKSFYGLSELADWIFGNMKQDYSSKNGNLVLYFPKGEEPSRICFRPEFRGKHYWIHQIESNDGIIFSDGTHTSGQKHWNSEVREWLKNCNERQYKPSFHFV